MMKKAQKCKVRFNDMMYQYRISPVAGKKESPIELLEQRRPRTNMPHLGKGNPRGDLKTKTHNYPIGITVMYRGGPDPDSSLHATWYPARITSHLEEPRSYLLENNYSKIVRRTEQHIRPYFTPRRSRPHHRRILLEDCESPPTYSASRADGPNAKRNANSRWTKNSEQTDGDNATSGQHQHALMPTQVDDLYHHRHQIYSHPRSRASKIEQNLSQEEAQPIRANSTPAAKGDVPYHTEAPIALTNNLIDTFS